MVLMAEVSAYLEGIGQLFGEGQSKRYPKNQLIQYSGDPLDQIYLIESGYVKAYTILDSGDTRTILILGPGDIFPLAFSASLDWDDYHLKYFYQSLGDIRAKVLPNRVLHDTIQEDSQMMNIYMNYMAASNSIIMRQLEVMKEKKAIDKVTMLLPYLASKTGKQIKPNIYELRLKLSHQEIADLSGVTRETTTTLIKELEKNGVIDQNKGQWRIDVSRLTEAAGPG